jgi:ATP-binding cassette subfamily B protein
METRIGEGGEVHLSGGEKQRIALARVVLKNPPVVILDEATASLDPENELLIQKAIANMVENKTLIVIAHRLRTIAGADRILVLDDGCIAEQGVHAQLLTDGGQYSRLWNEQQKAGGWKFGVRPAVS